MAWVGVPISSPYERQLQTADFWLQFLDVLREVALFADADSTPTGYDDEISALEGGGPQGQIGDDDANTGAIAVQRIDHGWIQKQLESALASCWDWELLAHGETTSGFTDWDDLRFNYDWTRTNQRLNDLMDAEGMDSDDHFDTTVSTGLGWKRITGVNADTIVYDDTGAQFGDWFDKSIPNQMYACCLLLQESCVQVHNTTFTVEYNRETNESGGDGTTCSAAKTAHTWNGTWTSTSNSAVGAAASTYIFAPQYLGTPGSYGHQTKAIRGRLRRTYSGLPTHGDASYFIRTLAKARAYNWVQFGATYKTQVFGDIDGIGDGSGGDLTADMICEVTTVAHNDVATYTTNWFADSTTDPVDFIDCAYAGDPATLQADGEDFVYEWSYQLLDKCFIRRVIDDPSRL